MLKFSLLSGVAMLIMAACDSSSGVVDRDGTQTTDATPNTSAPQDPGGTDTSTGETSPTADTPAADDTLENFTSGPVAFSVNDVSILFPAPETPADLRNNVIRLTDFQSDRVMPENLFQDVMALVTGPSTLTTPNGPIQVDAGAIPGTSTRIKFPGSNLRRNWAIAGIRIDPGAPGLSGDIFNVFGKSPQIRLILQPINQSGNNVGITDGSLHLVYAFHGPDDPAKLAQCILHNVPDMDGFGTAVNDLKGIKDRMAAAHGVNTDGRPLGIHPAFAAAGPEFKADLQNFLNTHLTTDRLFAVSIAGIPLPAPEPWVFLAMQQSPFSGRIEAVPSPATVQPGPLPNFGQMISFINSPQIQPAPATRNRRSINCDLNRTGQVSQQIPGAGVSTATVFDNGDPNISSIAATIADPTRSHFFNTDCVSCHTETRKEIDKGQTTEAAVASQNNIDPAVIPDEQWNVRAFGWFPGFPNRPAGAHETVTRRTAHETQEVVECFATENWMKVDQSCLP